MNNVQTRIESKLRERFVPSHLEVSNESGNHNVPPGSQTHFKVVIVSPVFEGKALLGRHRLVNATLKEELDGPVHALALHTYTPAQWQGLQNAPQSPQCLGGKAREAAL